MKRELKRFGLREQPDLNQDVITKKQYEELKIFKSNPNIIIRNADKINACVILDRKKYEEKLFNLTADSTKFKKLEKDPVENLKRDLNGIIDCINHETGRQLLPKLVGYYSPGYIYGNPKIHKNLEDPPLRPIISQVGTPAYDISKTLNDILKKYVPAKYIVESTDEFLNIVRSTESRGLLASLDVESLFTNVPVDTTIDRILQYAYDHPSIEPPTIPKNCMKQLLIHCTKLVPFKHIDGSLYTQVGGMSMGSRLSPLFSNFYMAHLENTILDSINRDKRPLVYCRYVDDIFLIVNNAHDVTYLKDKFETLSVLKFTFEIEARGRLTFLDIDVGSDLSTTVHVKSTHASDIFNYHSIAPERYKLGVIKTVIRRAYKISSSWYNFHVEVNRLKQLFTNNNFPINTIEREVKDFLDKTIRSSNHTTEELQDVKLYYCNQMSWLESTSDSSRKQTN